MVDDDDDFQEYKRTVHANRKARDKARIRHEDNTMKLAEGGKPVALDGLKLFQDSACDKIPDSVIQCRGLKVSGDRIGADAFLVNDTRKPGDRTLWVAVLKGGVILSRDFVMKGMGASIKYKAALKSRRNVWVSTEFKEKHAAIVKIITDTNEADSTTGRIKQHMQHTNMHIKYIQYTDTKHIQYTQTH